MYTHIVQHCFARGGRDCDVRRRVRVISKIELDHHTVVGEIITLLNLHLNSSAVSSISLYRTKLCLAYHLSRVVYFLSSAMVNAKLFHGASDITFLIQIGELFITETPSGTGRSDPNGKK